MKEKKFKV